MMKTIGIVVLVLGILLDDITTQILFFKSFHVIESNPIYQYAGNVGVLLFAVGFYIAFVITWILVIKRYEELYAKRLKGYKWFDVCVFMMCVALVTLAVLKIQAGMNNTMAMINYQDDAIKPQMDKYIADLNLMATEKPLEYKSMMNQYYKNVVNSFTYYQVALISLLSFLLFKVGNRTIPNGVD